MTETEIKTQRNPLLIYIYLIATLLICASEGMAQRETLNFDKGWKFSFGNAASPEKDFGCGTEYFNYLTKGDDAFKGIEAIISSMTAHGKR